MTVLMGNSLFTNQALDANPRSVLKQAFITLCTLPETMISPDSLGYESKNNRVVIKEREMMIKHATDPQRFVGTVHQSCCCTLYLWDEFNQYHGLIHVSAAGKGISDFVSHFKDKGNLNAILVGGALVDEPTKTLSKRNILETLKMLIELNQVVTIVSQKVLLSNKMTPTTYREYLRYSLLCKAQYFYRRTLDKPIPTYIFTAFKPDDFIHKDIDTQWVSREDVRIAYEDTLDMSLLKSEKKFVRNLQLLFTKTGFDVMSAFSFNSNLHHYPDLIHFAFDTESKMLHKLIDIEDNDLRQLYLYDPARGHHYHMAFNRGQYFNPVLSRQFCEDMIALYPIIKATGMTDELFVKLLKTQQIDKSHIRPLEELVLHFAPIFARETHTVCAQLWALPQLFPKPRVCEGLSFAVKGL